LLQFGALRSLLGIIIKSLWNVLEYAKALIPHTCLDNFTYTTQRNI
jgi:hypothetical protein